MAVTAKAVTPVTMGRFKKCRRGPRSRNGSKARTRIASVGMITTPTTSRFPGKYFKSWNRNRKYHSGRGVYVVSAGLARASSGAPTK